MHTAKIIAVTEPLVCNDAGIFLTVEEFVAYCARVSNPSNQMNTETSPKLLKYLMKNKHWSPFEMVSVTMDVETTRDIARQILRHRSFSFQEFSQRYADPTQSQGFVTKEARLQDPKNRQNSIEGVSSEVEDVWHRMQSNVIGEAEKAYAWAVRNGIAKEQARAVLPEGLTVSRLYMSGTLRSWIHYCDLRRANGTQKEHRLLADSAWRELIRKFDFLKEVG